MKRSRFTGLLAGAVAVVAASLMAHAAGIFPGFPTVGVGGAPVITGVEVIPADTGLAGGVAPQTVLIPSSVLAGATWNTPRNLLGNGGLNITNSNGTSTVTCAANAAPTVAALSADRWACQANVAVGAGRTAIVTASPAPPTGFTNSMKVFRTSGALTQPVCVWSAVPTPQSTQLQGQTVTFSAYVAALAGLAADNGGVANMVVISGTGTDEGLNASPTASPAITPAWTGISTLINTPITLATTFARFSTTVAVPATATEIGVGLCFTPTATGSGATDGFAWTGAQLEKAPSPSLFEVRSKAQEVIEAQAYFYVINEGVGPTPRGFCNFSTANTVCQAYLTYPTTLYKTPTLTFANGFAVPTTTAQTALTPCTGFATDATEGTIVQSLNGTLAQCTTGGTTAAVGLVLPLFDNGGTGSFKAWTGL